MERKLKNCDGCNTPKVIWKSSGTGGKRYCQSCWSAHSGKKQIPTVKRQKPIPPRSIKRSKEDKIYLGKRIIFLAKYSMCQAAISGICTGKSTECHHKAGRIGDLLTNEEYFLAICHACHREIEMNPTMALEQGFSIKRLTNDKG